MNKQEFYDKWWSYLSVEGLTGKDFDDMLEAFKNDINSIKDGSKPITDEP